MRPLHLLPLLHPFPTGWHLSLLTLFFLLKPNFRLFPLPYQLLLKQLADQFRLLQLLVAYLQLPVHLFFPVPELCPVLVNNPLASLYLLP